MVVTVQRSLSILLYLLLIHSAAGLMLWYLGANWVVTVGLLLLISASLVYQLRRHGWLGLKPWLRLIRIDGDNNWFIQLAADREAGPFVLKRSVVLGPMILIYLQSASKRWPHPVLVTQDMVSFEQWRRLRIRLRDPQSWDQ